MKETGRNIAVACVFDEQARIQSNSRGLNFWFAYIEEIFSHLGIQAQYLKPEALEDESILARFSAIIMGEGMVSEHSARNLQIWAEQGGTLIGFRCEALKDLFGFKPVSIIEQPKNDFTITAYLSLTDSALAEGIHSPWHPEQNLVIFSDVILIEPKGSEQIARLYNTLGEDMSKPAITKRQVGEGWAFYFTFDLPKTVWVLQQGRPIDADYDGDGYLRTGDAIIIGKNDPELLYSYELVLLLQNMLAIQPHPFIYSLPPTKGKVTDALFFYGGDDECSSGIQLPASRFMRSRNLPYHINIMPVPEKDIEGEWKYAMSQGEYGEITAHEQGHPPDQQLRVHKKDITGKWKFAVSRDEFGEIVANGHECSLHYNFLYSDQHPHFISREEVLRQMDAYTQAFGQKPVCTVNHWCLWSGWYELAEWMLEAGGQADNCRFHVSYPPLNPVNRIGFSFGTALPYRVYTDWNKGNKPLDFLFLPVIFYEVGYSGDSTDFELLHKAIDIAAYYHLTADFFYHPVYIVHNKTCRLAIDELLRYVEERNLIVQHMGCDKLVHWWRARQRVSVQDVTEKMEDINFHIDCPYDDGCIVRLSLGDRPPMLAICDGKDVVSEVRKEFGQNWLYMVIPQGEHEVKVVKRKKAVEK